jgi:hypothetical protein
MAELIGSSSQVEQREIFWEFLSLTQITELPLALISTPESL